MLSPGNTDLEMFIQLGWVRDLMGAGINANREENIWPRVQIILCFYLLQEIFYHINCR